MQERIKIIRKANKLTQTEFGKRIGIKGNTITGYETGLRVPSSAVIRSISKEFNISEDWLRTGEGEMQTPVNRDTAIGDFMGKVMNGEDADFRRRLVAVLSKLDTAEWELLEKMALKLAEENKKEGQA